MDSAWQFEVDKATPADWDGMLALFDDANFYQTWSYGKVRWGAESLSHLVLRRAGEVQAIAQLRIVRPTKLKFGMAYLRWGPLFKRRGQPLDVEVATRIAEVLQQEYVEKRQLFVRVIPNAFVGTPRAQVFQAAFAKFFPEPLTADNTYRTFVVDISPEPHELRKRLDPKWRNKLSGAERNGLKLIVGSGVNEYQSFCRIYRNMRSRKAFETTVDVDEFGRIQEELPEQHRMRVLICEDNGVPVAGVVASAMGDSAIYLLGATSDEGLNSKGAYLLQWTMIRWLRESGVRWYDLGGIDPQGNPGVYTFKKGLSGLDVIQMAPLTSSTSTVSSVMVKAGMAMQRVFRSSPGSLKFGRAVKKTLSRKN